MPFTEDVAFTPRPPESEAPCALACAKCGAADISRHHRLAGDSWSNCGTERIRTNAFVDVGRFTARALRECLTHHCRTCQYDWETTPLGESTP